MTAIRPYLTLRNLALVIAFVVSIVWGRPAAEAVCQATVGDPTCGINDPLDAAP
jgi:hypothetical protein